MFGINIDNSILMVPDSIQIMTFPSSSGIYVDSINTEILVEDSSIVNTISTKTMNAVYLQCGYIEITNSVFRNGNLANGLNT